MRLHGLESSWKYPVLLIAALMLAGCRSYVLIPVDEAQAVIEQGDHVRLQTTNGRQVELVVQSVTHDALSANEPFALADIETLERKQVDLARSGGIVLGAIGSGLLVALVATATVF